MSAFHESFVEVPQLPAPGEDARSYIRYLKGWAGIAGVDSFVYDRTMKAWNDFFDFDKESAAELALGTHIAIGVGMTIKEVYGDDVAIDLANIWAGNNWTDLYKKTWGKDRVEKSNHGTGEWTADDEAIQKEHPKGSGQWAIEAEMPLAVVRIVQEHHGLQLGCCYGLSAEMSWEERTDRDCVAAADVGLAVFRPNRRNLIIENGIERPTTLEEKSAIVRRDLEVKFGTYDRSQEVIAKVHKRLMNQAVQVAPVLESFSLQAA